MQIFEITARRNESALKGMNTIVAPTKLAAPPTFDYQSAAKLAGLTPTAAPTATPTQPVAPTATPTQPVAPAQPAAPGAPAMTARDRVDVAGGKLGRAAQQGVNVLGAIGSSLGSQILTKAGLPGDLGMSKSTNPFGDKENQARKAAEKTNKTLANQLYKQWTAAAATNAPNSPAMQQSLDRLVNNTLLRGKNPANLVNYIAHDKKQEVANQLQKIEQGKQALASKNAQMTYQDWANMVNAASELNILSSFWPEKYSGVEMKKDGKFYSNNRELDLQNPRDFTMIQRAIQEGTLRMPDSGNIQNVEKMIQATKAKQAQPAATTAQPSPATSKATPAPPPGAPTSAELANYEKRVQQALAAQGQTA